MHTTSINILKCIQIKLKKIILFMANKVLQKVYNLNLNVDKNVIKLCFKKLYHYYCYYHYFKKYILLYNSNMFLSWFLQV